MRRVWSAAAAGGAVVLTLAVLGCAGTSGSSADAAGSTGSPRLVGSAPCEGAAGFDCSTLTVPLDHAGRTSGTLDLAVAVADNAEAPKGVLLFLTGGPGQPGVSLLPRVQAYLDPAVRRDYRVVVLDQRGTGPRGINCAALQASNGGADFATPDARDLRACARQLGKNRAFYRTSDTVRDLEFLRRAVGARRMVIDGVSYGTYVASQYALKNPQRVSALVLDSVVPSDGFDPLGLDGMRAAGPVLRKACSADPACTADPVADLAWVTRHAVIDGKRVDPTAVMQSLAVMSLSSVNPSFAGIPGILRDARAGNTAPLAQWLRQTDSGGTPYDALSAGLHAATVCTDLRYPWGRSDAPVAGREQAVDRAMGRVGAADTYPYPRSTARAMFAIDGCRRWPATPPTDAARSHTLKPRTLIVQGSNDLFCPQAWARWQHRRADRSTLLVIDGIGHGTQGSAKNPAARNAVRTFLGARA